MKRVVLIGLFGPLVLLCAAKPTKPATRWELVKDAYRVHERLLNVSGAVLGEYYEVQSGDVRAVCYPPGDKIVSLKTEQDARAFVQKCKVWQ